MSRTTSAGSVMPGQARFAKVPGAQIMRSSFDRSCGHKTTFDAGYLVPIFCDEALPGDTFSMDASMFARMATPLKPTMDNFYMDTFWFFVPNRLLWDNWEKFNGAQDDPGDSTDFQLPTMTQTVASGDLSDYMGIPIGSSLTFVSLWHRAYNLIFNEWFRDENLTDSLVVDRDDGPDTAGDYTLQRRAKRHDYFSSCLPFAQKGLAVELPLGSAAPVVSAGTGIPTFDFGTDTNVHLESQAGVFNVDHSGAGAAGVNTGVWNTTNLEADLSAATAATINEIREAFQIQRLLERDARGGTRYTEIIRSHFGVVSPDARLQRPEYLGGSSQRIGVTVVAQSTDTGVGSPTARTAVGALGGFATVGDRARWVKSFTEHGVVLGLVNVRADLTYQQGLERMFNRRNRFDMYWPALSMLGEQTVLSKEIYADGTGSDDDTFGYQERYAEYRYKPSRISGIFRSDAAASLDVWHLGLDFAARPVLNNTFIEDDPPFDRIVAVPAEPHFIFDSHFKFRCARPMPTYSVPGLIDHL